MSKEKSGQLRRQRPAGVEVPAGAVRILESHHATDFAMKLGVWPFHKLCWVAVGSGCLDYDGESIPLEGGDLCLLPMGHVHRFVDNPKQPLTLIILCISEKYVQSALGGRIFSLWEKLLKNWPAGAPHRPKTAFHLNHLLDDFRLALREQTNQQPGWEISLGTATARILICLTRGFCVPADEYASRSEHTVKGAIEYINARPYERLQIEQMAERCQISPRRFTDLFKQITGNTFSNYVNQRRIAYACQRLDEAGHIAYACYESGFNDLAYFYRVFKKLKGCTPGQYLQGEIIF